MSGRLKGQFFMLGAILLCGLFFVALPAGTTLTGSHTLDMTRLADNLEGEIPHALNLAMLEDGNPSKLGDFMGFSRDKTGERYISLEGLWVVAVPDGASPGDIDVHAGNWLGRPVTVSITAGGPGQEIALDDGESDSRSFSGVGDDFTLEVSFEGRAWSGQVARDKTNLYSYIRLSRGENSIVKEITG
jgi:hypothetical protein